MLVFREGLVLEGARHYCSGERRYVATNTEVGSPPHPLSHTPGAGALPPPAREEGWPTAGFGLLPRAPPSAGTGHHTPVPRVVVPKVRGQRSVTLFSRAAAICCRR